MAENGLKTVTLTPASLADELIGNKDGLSVRITVNSLGQQMLGVGPVADAINLLEDRVLAGLTPASSWADLQTLVPTADDVGSSVPDTDTGTHLQATATGYDGPSVPNAGTYRWESAWSRWKWVGDTGLAGKANVIHGHALDDVTGLQTALDAKAPQSALDELTSKVNGLDAAIVLQDVWDASSGSFPGAGSAQRGNLWIVSVAGTVDSVEFGIGDRIVAIVDDASSTTFAGNWFKEDYTDQVLRVNGKTGDITLEKDDVGLGDVDNTPDADKPVSGPQQAAFDAEVAAREETDQVIKSAVLSNEPRDPDLYFARFQPTLLDFEGRAWLGVEDGAARMPKVRIGEAVLADHHFADVPLISGEIGAVLTWRGNDQAVGMPRAWFGRALLPAGGWAQDYHFRRPIIVTDESDERELLGCDEDGLWFYQAPGSVFEQSARLAVSLDDVPLALLANAHEAELCAPALTRVRGVDESGIGRSFVMRRDRTPGAVIASTRGRLRVTTVYGQSYGTGGGAADQYDEEDPIFSTVVSPDPSFRNLDLMLNPTEDGTGISMTQGNPLNAADLVDFNPAAESPWDPTTTLGGELGMRAFAAFLRASQRADGIAERPHLLFSHGDGGQSLPVLADTDGNPYKNGLIAMAAVKRIAAIYGYDIALETFIWDHGQAASSYPYGQYTTEFLNLWADYKADMLAITGQSLVDNPLMTIVHQIASNAVTRGGRPNAIDQLDLMNNNPGAILTIPGPYHLTVADDTHLDKASTVLQREQVAKIMEVYRRTGSWTGVQPLALENWTVDGSQLTIPYETQGYALAFEPDIGVIPPPEDGNKGFWSPGLTITSAEIIGSSVRLTYSASLGGEVPRVLYAYRRDTNPPGEPYYGARGMLRNTDPTASREFPQITLPTWAYVFDNKPEEGQPAGVQ